MAIVTTLIEASGHTMNTTALFFTPGNRKTSCMQFTQCISTVYKSLWNEWKSVNVLHKALFTPNTKCQLHFLQMLWSWFTPFALVSWVVEKNQVMLARERQESNTLFLLTPSQVSASSCQLNSRKKMCFFQTTSCCHQTAREKLFTPLNADMEHWWPAVHEVGCRPLDKSTNLFLDCTRGIAW